MEEIVAFRTSDGSLFPTKQDAINHEESLIIDIINDKAETIVWDYVRNKISVDYYITNLSEVNEEAVRMFINERLLISEMYDEIDNEAAKIKAKYTIK
jgi:hypothetical protein